MNATHVGRFGSCCRSHFECNSRRIFDYKRAVQSNSTTNCDCDKDFSECLDKSSNMLSNVFEYSYILSTRKCIAHDHPIIECVKFQYFSEPYAEFSRAPHENELRSEQVRCIQYNVDKTKPKIFQLFDLPFLHQSNRYDVVQYLDKLANTPAVVINSEANDAKLSDLVRNSEIAWSKKKKV